MSGHTGRRISLCRQRTGTGCGRNGIRPSRETGAALVVSLVILLILSVIGISALMGTALESKMAGNVQEMNRAFQAAETGIDNAIVVDGVQESGTLSGSVSLSSGDDPSRVLATVSYGSTFCCFAKPPRKTTIIFGDKAGRSARFETASTGRAGIGAKTKLTQGWYKMAPNPSGSILYE